MTQCDQLVVLLRENGWTMTLVQLLEYPVGYKATSRFSDLRKEGYVITCEKGATPSLNLYTMIEPIVWKSEGNGQLLCA